MRNYWILIALLFHATTVLAWEFELVREFSVLPSKPVELPNGDILIHYSEAALLYASFQSTQILRLGSNGENKGVTDFTNHFSNRIMFAFGLSYINGYLVLAGQVIDTNGERKPCLLKMTLDLNVVFDTIYNVQGYFMEVWQSSVSDYFISAVIGDPLVKSYRSYWRLDSSFNIKAVLTDSTLFLPHEYGWSTYDPKGDIVYYFSADYQTLTKFEAGTLNQIGFFQSRTAHLESYPYVNSEGNVLMTGLKFMNWPFEDHNNFFVFDSNLRVTDSLTYYDNEFTSRPSANTSTFEQDSYYYLGATNNFGTSSSIVGETEYRSFMLLKMDKSANLIWARKYRNDGAYWMSYVQGVKDGGVLMVGARWNWPEDSLKKEVSLYVLKVDSGGVITGTGEDIVKEPNFIIYPNPNNGSFTLQTSGNQEGYIRISNLQGQEVFLSKFDSGPIHFITTNLRPGLYIATVFQQKKVFTTRFIIK